jgi:Zn-dependent membrane protease YugP
MKSHFSKSNDCSNLNSHTDQLEWMFEMLKLRLCWKSVLLKEQRHKMTAIEVARTILRNCGRTDVKVCYSQDERNCYSLLWNLVGLSQDVADSRSVMAAAIAAHEIGHALQPKVAEKTRGVLKKLFIPHLATMGDLAIWAFRIARMIRFHKPTWNYITSHVKATQAEKPAYTWSLKMKLWYTLESVGVTNPRSLFGFLRGLIHLIAIVLFSLINSLRSLIRLLVTLPLFAFVILLLLGCACFCRFLRFLVELQASWWALRLLKQHKVLETHEWRAARKFLLAAALTYLRSPSLDFI